MMSKRLRAELQQLRRQAAEQRAAGAGAVTARAVRGGLLRSWVVLGHGSAEPDDTATPEDQEAQAKARRRFLAEHPNATMWWRELLD